MRPDLVYLVEDNEVYSEATSYVLKDKYDIKQFFSARLALNSIDGGETPDLIILDNHMPGMTGLEFCQHLKIRNIEIPIVIVSGLVDAKLATAAISLGISSVLQKPITIPDLNLALERAQCAHQLRKQETLILKKYIQMTELTKKLLGDSEDRYIQAENQLFKADIPPYADLDQRRKFIAASLRDNRIRQEIMNCEAEIQELTLASQKAKETLGQMLSQDVFELAEVGMTELNKTRSS